MKKYINDDFILLKNLYGFSIKEIKIIENIKDIKEN